jgi:hypothetical protein
MKNFAIIENEKIVNVIVCDALVIAQALLPNLFLVEESNTTGKAIIGGSLLGDKFIAPKPYDSWTLNTTTFEWDSPIPYPNDEFSWIWNEAQQNWEKIDLEELDS